MLTKNFLFRLEQFLDQVFHQPSESLGCVGGLCWTGILGSRSLCSVLQRCGRLGLHRSSGQWTHNQRRTEVSERNRHPCVLSYIYGHLSVTVTPAFCLTFMVSFHAILFLMVAKCFFIHKNIHFQRLQLMPALLLIYFIPSCLSTSASMLIT
jgi:hypothetical protein